MSASSRSAAKRGSGWDEAAIASLESICAGDGCDTARDEPLARHTSMGVGGPTPLMVWPHHPEALAATLGWCAARGLGWRVLGGGTNVLVADAGVRQPVINLTRLTDGAKVGDPLAVFPAGVPTAGALRACAKAGLAGLVWSTGLPGTIGGAAAGNAGCWGGQMADVVARLDLLDSTAAWHSIDAADLEWRYRRLCLPDELGTGAVIVRVVVKVRPDDPSRLIGRCYELQQLKRDSQPVGARNAGCIFKNPDPQQAAGLLIDRAGCKGLQVGKAQISEMHGNFLINLGGARAADVDELIGRVKSAVHSMFGVVLEEEIRRW